MPQVATADRRSRSFQGHMVVILDTDMGTNVETRGPVDHWWTSLVGGFGARIIVVYFTVAFHRLEFFSN